jgi:Ca2+-binding EF-hand superfamily protein
MGNQQYQERRAETHYTRWDAPRLQQMSGIDASRLPQIHQEFIRAAGADGLLNRGEFGRLYRELNAGPGDEGSIDRAFRALDRDGSGKLSFDEFLSAAILLNKNANPRERISYLIDSNNPSGINNTLITPDYGRHIVRNMNQFYGTNADFDQIWSKINANNGQVHREEFVRYVSQAPTFVQYF